MQALSITLSAAASAIPASIASAETIACELRPPCQGRTACDAAPVSVTFSIDHNQFARAIDANEPPRRKLTQVEMGAARFPAEPIVMGDLRGFHAEGWGGSQLLMIIQADGSGRYTNARTGEVLEGQCEVVRQ